MLSELDEYAYKGETGRPEKCRPDYEAQVKRLNNKVSKTKSLLSALLDYIDVGQIIKGPLAEMIGELVCEERRLYKKIEAVMEQWEADPEPKK